MATVEHLRVTDPYTRDVYCWAFRDDSKPKGQEWWAKARCSHDLWIVRQCATREEALEIGRAQIREHGQFKMRSPVGIAPDLPGDGDIAALARSIERSMPQSGALRLAAEVILRALDDLRSPQPYVRGEAERWLTTRTEGIFSFAQLSTYFGLDQGAVLAAIGLEGQGEEQGKWVA